MTLLGLPLPAVIALAVVGTALVLLLRRPSRAPRAVTVSSLLLWRKVRAQAGNEKQLGGRGSGALLLAIAIVLLLSAASGDPVWSPPPAPKTTLILLDASRTMATQEGDETRLSLAKAAVKRRLLALRAETRALLVVLAPTPEPLGAIVAKAADATPLIAKLEQVRAGRKPVDRAALERFLTAVVPELKPARILLVSDGVSLPQDPQALAVGAVPVEQLTVGGDQPNVAFTNLGARRSSEDRDRAAVRAVLESSGNREVGVRVSLLDDSRPVQSATVRVPAGGSAVLDLPDVLCLSGRLTANLEATDQVNALSADDVAYAALPPRRALRVWLVTAGNVFLRAALQADSRVELTETTLAEFESDPVAIEADLVVLDGVVPNAPPTRPRLYLHPEGTPPAAPFAVVGHLSRPFFERVSARDPLTAGLALSDVNIAGALKVRTRPGDMVAAAAREGPLLIRGQRAGQRMAALTMRLSETDLPLRTAFPVLVRNALDWLSGSEGAYQDPLPLADDLPLPAGTAGPLFSADGAEQPLQASSTGPRFTPQEPGFYELQGQATPVAVTPAAQGSVSLAPHATWPEPTKTKTPQDTWPPLWQCLSLLALLLMALEFWNVQRRGVKP